MLKKIIVVLLLTNLLILCSMLPSCKQETQTQEEITYISPYNWDALVNEEDRYFYYEDGQIVSKIGIDVSDHQAVIDWEAVSADGVGFAIIRLGNRGYTEGNIYLDTQYYANIEGAQAAGLEVGVYFFSQAVSEEEAREEAEFVLNHLQGYLLDYPVVYDYETVDDPEGRANYLSKTQATENALAFCRTIESSGYDAMLYGNKKDYARYDQYALADYEVWFAEYDAPTPSGQFDFTIWQYTDKGVVSGVNTNVDMNIHFIAS